MKKSLGQKIRVLFVAVFAFGNAGQAAEKEEFTWQNQQLECRQGFTSLLIQMNPLKPFARATYAYETASAVCNFESRTPDFQCVGFWSFKKDMLQISVKQSRVAKAPFTATFQTSSTHKNTKLQIPCVIRSQPKNAGREVLQQ